MATLADVATLLAGTQGRRKSLLYFSEGIDYNVADVMASVQRYASEVTHAIEHALSTAIRTNVALYAIDPRGLVVEIDGRNLTFESKDSRFTERLDLPMLTVDANCTIVNK